MNWSKNKWTEAERKHMAEGNIRSRDDMIVTRRGQKEMQAISGSEICWECRNIAVKMGVEDSFQAIQSDVRYFKPRV